jgi:ferritin-like metal-binding protein YciE
MPNKKLDDLFCDVLKDIYYAEMKFLESLPKMVDAAQSEELRDAFLKHREETQGQVERLKQIFEMIGQPAKGKTCEAMRGIIDEDQQIMERAEADANRKAA